MDIRSLQVFLSVCGTLSFTQSAEDLHMSVSAVSRAVQRLEEELGTKLFDRDRRGIHPTSAALPLRQYAEHTLGEWKALRLAVGEGSAVRGELRIFCSVTASYRLLSPLLQAYRAAYPAVDVRLQTGDQADGLEKVRQGHADVAMIAQPRTLPDTLNFQPVARTPLMLCLPGSPEHLSSSLEQKNGRAFWRALAESPWILPERGVTRDITDAWLRERLKGEGQIYARVSGHEAIVAMVSLGLGVGIVPRLVVHASALVDQVRLRASGGLPDLVIGLCARTGRLTDPVVASLLKVAQTQARDDDGLEASTV